MTALLLASALTLSLATIPKFHYNQQVNLDVRHKFTADEVFYGCYRIDLYKVTAYNITKKNKVEYDLIPVLGDMRCSVHAMEEELSDPHRREQK